MSLFPVSTPIVKAAAQKAIQHIENKRHSIYENTLKEYMKPRHFLWFKLKTRTKEQAEKKMHKNSCVPYIPPLLVGIWDGAIRTS